VDDVNATLANGPYASNSAIAAIYSKFTVNFSALPSTAAGTYFAHFKDSSTGFRGRVWASTAAAASGSFRLGIANAAGSVSTNFPVDLSLGTPYTVVTRYELASGRSTIWVGPANETSTSALATDAPNISTGMGAFGMRQSTGEGTLALDDLVVGTKFADVIPASAGQNPPFITKEPQDANVPAGTVINLSVIAGGDTPTYQWRKDGVDIGAATTSAYSFSTAAAETAGYSVVIANSAGTITSRVASVTTTIVVVAPAITTEPQSTTVTYGESPVFNVVATGTEPLAYQWTFYGTNLSGATAAFYTVSSAFPANAGPYQVIVTNSAGSATSQVATLTVNAPPLTNIAYLRSTVDSVNYLPTNTTSRFTAEGIVTSWDNLTSGTINALFYFQDSTAGIAVFYNGGYSNRPAAGSRVRVTATLSHYNGLLEMMPNATNQIDSVTVVSTGNPLPAATAVPFDASQSDPIVMEALEGKYVVASNVFLANPGTVFASVSAGEYLTNNLGETFNMYINSYTDIPAQTKPFGPVTVFGVMGQFDSSNPRTSGYQMIPTRYADIISQAKAAKVVFTNHLSNLVRPTGLQTNTFGESVLRPGEDLLMDFTATDPDGGSVTITPLNDGLPAEAAWSIPSASGTTVTGSLTFQPTAANAGTQYTFRLRTQTSTALATNTWIIYVPTADEQQVFITEMYPNPTGDTNFPGYNPLHRAEPVTSNPTVADEYIEIVNLGSMDIDLYGWTVADAVSIRHKFYNGASGGEVLPNHNAIIVYGGPLSGNLPTLPVSAFPASESSAGLALNNTGSETITIRNASSNIIDRIVYTAAMLSPSGSLSRFPTVNDWFVPQAWISVNNSTAGLQYDGGAWGQPTKAPAGTTLLSITYGNPLMLTFTASTTVATTLWNAKTLPGTFTPIAGQVFTNTTGVFYITNPPAPQGFYGVTTQ
jgi:hypothetical protein